MSYVLYKQKQEAQTLQEQEPATIYDIAKGKTKYRKQYIAYDNIERANKPENATAVTSVVGEKAQKVVSVVAQKLKGKRKEFIANLKYIGKITGKKRRQNINIINQINGTAFKIISYKKYKNQRNCYVFTHLENTTKKDNSKVQNIAQLEPFQPLAPSCIQELYKNNNTESIRSNVHAHESKFLLNYKEVKITATAEPEIVNSSPAPVNPVKFKKRLPNERKKPTNAEKKARVYHFYQYKDPQPLSYHYPLSQEDGAKLQTLSGRAFTLQAMNEMLLSMSKRLDNTFLSKAQFMAYFGKVLRYEKRDAIKTNNVNFHIKANHTQERLAEIDQKKRVEKYLAELEQRAIDNVCPENQLKARLANVLEPLRSYELLSNIKDFKVFGNTMRIYLRSQLQLNDSEKSIVLSQVQSIYSNSEFDIEGVEYVVENVYKLKSTNEHGSMQTKKEVDLPLLQQSAWGDVCRQLIKTYGIHIYNNWFSKLIPLINEDAKTIVLKAPNLFIQQWVETNYGEGIRNIIKKLGLELKELFSSSELKRGY